MLAAGGTAADAAIAVDAVLSVVLPDTCGPGGDLFVTRKDRRGDVDPFAEALGQCIELFDQCRSQLLPVLVG